MTIIRYGEPDNYRIECSECKSILGFNSKDIDYDIDESFGEFHFINRLKCPVCKNKILLSIDEHKYYKMIPHQSGITYWEIINDKS